MWVALFNGLAAQMEQKWELEVSKTRSVTAPLSCEYCAHSRVSTLIYANVDMHTCIPHA